MTSYSEHLINRIFNSRPEYYILVRYYMHYTDISQNKLQPTLFSTVVKWFTFLAHPAYVEMAIFIVAIKL